MKKIQTIKGFTLILSLGTIISFLGRIPYRIIPLIILTGTDYTTFSLTLLTFMLSISIAGLTLHSPLTREIRLNVNSKEEQMNFAMAYWITSLIGAIFMFIMGSYYIRAFSPLQLSFFSITIIFRSFMEFFIANTRALGYAVKSAIISSIPAIFEGLILIPFLLEIEFLLNVNFFLYIYCFGLISSFIFGAILSKSSWKILIYSFQKLFSKEHLWQAIKNIKKGLLLSTNAFFRLLGKWLVIFIAIEIMTINSFKILDLSLFLISFTAMFSSNLLISTLSASNIEDKSIKSKKLVFLIVLGIIVILIIFLFLDFIPLEFIFKEFFNLTLTTEGRNIIRFVILMIFSMFMVAYLGGKAQALGKYKEIAFTSIISFIGLLIFLILGYFMNSGIILIISLVTLDLIEGLLYYYFLYS